MTNPVPIRILVAMHDAQQPGHESDEDRIVRRIVEFLEAMKSAAEE